MRYVPILGWIPTYDRRDLRPDLIAGVVSWGVMVPVAMAYAGLAGLPPQAGLVTAFAAMAAYAVFGTTRHLKVTTSSSVSVMSAAVVGALAVAGDPRYLELSAMLALLVGLFLLAAGLAKLGFMSQFLAKSVVTGFVIGLAITIIIGQLPALLGIPSSTGGILERLADLVGEGPSVNVQTLVVGVSALVLILVLRRVAPRIPGALVALVGGIVISVVLDLAGHGVAVVGEIQTGVPLPSMPSVGIRDIAFLATGAMGIVFLALAESLGAGRSFASRHGYDLDPDQELVALGASNLATGFLGGFVVDASLSQSATAEAAGARTQLASLVTSGLVLGTAIVLAPLFADLPKAVLAAIVITSVLSLVDLGELRRYWAYRRTDLILALTALVGVIATSALVGMAIAVMLSLAVILFQASRPYMARLGKLPGKPTSYGDLSRHPRAREVPGHPHPPPRRATDVRELERRQGPDRRDDPQCGAAAGGRGPRPERDRRPRHRDHRHVRGAARLPRRSRGRLAPGAGPRHRPRPDAPLRGDGQDRRSPGLPGAGRGGRGEGRGRGGRGSPGEQPDQ